MEYLGGLLGEIRWLGDKRMEFDVVPLGNETVILNSQLESFWVGKDENERLHIMEKRQN